MVTLIQTSPSHLISNTLLLTQPGLALPIQEASLPQPELLPTITSVSFARPIIYCSKLKQLAVLLHAQVTNSHLFRLHSLFFSLSLQSDYVDCDCVWVEWLGHPVSSMAYERPCNS